MKMVVINLERRRHYFKFLILFCLINYFIEIVQCRSVKQIDENDMRIVQRMRREALSEEVTSKQTKVCIVGDVVYGAGEFVAASDLCQQCQCHPPGVKCAPIQCPAPIAGCKALHRPDKCCPSYQCECVKGNRTYANGETLMENPNDPCKKCYCRGGEIQCAKIGCYLRDDCVPIYVKGQCCPKYDNCPPRDQQFSSTTELSSIEFVQLNETSIEDLIDEFTSSSGSFENPEITSFEDVVTESPIGDDENRTWINIKEIHPKITIKEILPTTSTTTTPNLPPPSPPKREISAASNPPPPPPSVIKVGNNVIVYDNGEIKPVDNLSSTPKTVINVYGAEGLQIGGVNGNEIVHHHVHDDSTFKSSTEPDYVSSSTQLNDIGGSSTSRMDNPEYPPIPDDVADDNTFVDNAEKLDNSKSFESTSEQKSAEKTSSSTINSRSYEDISTESSINSSTDDSSKCCRDIESMSDEKVTENYHKLKTDEDVSLAIDTNEAGEDLSEIEYISGDFLDKLKITMLSTTENSLNQSHEASFSNSLELIGADDTSTTSTWNSSELELASSVSSSQEEEVDHLSGVIAKLQAKESTNQFSTDFFNILKDLFDKQRFT